MITQKIQITLTTIIKPNYHNIPINEIIEIWDKEGIEKAADLFFNYSIGNLIIKHDEGESAQNNEDGFFNPFI